MKQRKRVNNVCDMKIECKLKKSKYLNFQKPINLLNLFISLEKVKKIKLKLNPMTLPREHKGTNVFVAQIIQESSQRTSLQNIKHNLGFISSLAFNSGKTTLNIAHG